MKRFWDKVDKTQTCWLWTAGLDGFGYGQFRLEGKNVRAHRVSFYFAYGYWPRLTRHSCDTPACVRPEHLVEGTQKENNEDIANRGRHKWSVTNEQAVEIRKMAYDDSVISRVCDTYNISENTARNILSGKTYVHIDPPGKPIPRQKGSRKLDDETIEKIAAELRQNYWGQQTYLAHKYGVSRNLIQRIQNGTY